MPGRRAALRVGCRFACSRSPALISRRCSATATPLAIPAARKLPRARPAWILTSISGPLASRSMNPHQEGLRRSGVRSSRIARRPTASRTPREYGRSRPNARRGGDGRRAGGQQHACAVPAGRCRRWDLQHPQRRTHNSHAPPPGRSLTFHRELRPSARGCRLLTPSKYQSALGDGAAERESMREVSVP